MPSNDPQKPHDPNPEDPRVRPQSPDSGEGPKGPDSGAKPHRPKPEIPEDPRQHPLIEQPEKPTVEVPPKPQRDLPYSDPTRAGERRAAGRDSDPPDTDPMFLPWQAPTSARRQWLTEPLKPPPR